MAVEMLVLVPVWQEGGELFSRRERSGVSDADYEQAAAEFSDKELADLTYAIGLMNAYNRFGVAFRMTPAAARG